MTEAIRTRNAAYRRAFATRLKQALRDNNIKPRPAELARKFNAKYKGAPVTNEAARQWLTGDSLPRPDKLTVLAAMLGRTLYWLRTGLDSEAA